MIAAGGARRLAASRAAPYLVALAAFAVFAPTLRFGFVYDDATQILKNPWIWDVGYLGDLLTRSVWSFRDMRPSNYYRPVQTLLYFIDAQLFGRHPFGFHLTNVVMHSAVAVACLLLLRRITTPLRALFAALLFAVHPAHVESVAWIAGSTDVNCAFLVLLTLLAWRRAAEVSGWAAVRRHVAAGVLFLLALLAKEIAVVIPVLAFLLPPDAAPGANGAAPGGSEAARDAVGGAPRSSAGRPGGGWRGARARFVAASVLSFGGGLAACIALRLHALGTLKPIVERPEMTSGEVIGGGLAQLVRYLAVLFFPWRLIPDRVVPPTGGPLEPLALLGAALLIAACAGMVLLRRRVPRLAFGIALTVLPLLPVLRIDLFSYDHQPDRYLYLPSVGMAILVAEIGSAAMRRAAPVLARLAVPAAIVLLAAGAARTLTAAEMWRDDLTLARAGMALSPASVSMRLVLISALDAAGRPEEALAAARAALDLHPDNLSLRSVLSGLEGRLEADTPEDAIAIYRAALAADPARPHLWANLAASYVEAGEAAPAIESARNALGMDQYNEVAILNLGTALGLTGDHAGQEREARRLLDLNPESAGGWFNLGAARLSQEDPAAAAEALNRAVALDPSLARAHFYLSHIASRQGDLQAAIASARRAVEIDEANADYWTRLGVALARAGDPAAAGEAWRRALAIDPDHEQAAAYLKRLGEKESGR
jgi:tetratricopeptide (TPR) repeat protein